MRIDVRDLVLRYGETTALDGLTFTLESGKIYGLLGRNGSGKSSLTSVLAAFRRQTSGEALVDGRPVFENADLTRRIGLVRDEGEAITIGTVEDALYFAEGLRPNWDAGYARSLLETFGIPPKANVKAMSKGQRSALGVVVGLASRTPLTMFDEAHLGMDVPSRQAFHDALLADYMAHPRTFVLASHLIEEAAPLFEEVLIIDRGRLVVQEDAGTLLSRGVSVTGPVARVDAFTAGLTVLGARDLGPTRSAMVYGDLDDTRRREAAEAGLELGPVAMQELFVHLTGGPR
ncbi:MULTISPECIES: ATP-binding cassette domain-containing protein [Streptosporangium]|uniref:ABC-2 type transport system ATP-binding protein n=2 Tax=Streptosporangium TaxID=2000 RepID=A0A852UQ09_9ACTN|nr:MULTISPECIES: ABC transporter ATP-binding protein [Streptosporangium]NYF39577.1 ABC-2 type transport system ATP-binding protein [Streptosporangium sandarakinum]GGP88440.1 ABC transporter [Streptosporangium pseudovulgare]